MIFFIISFSLFLWASVTAQRTVREEEFIVGQEARAKAGTLVSESDEPIRSWQEDALGRAAIVDIVTAKAMISRSPIIAISGPLGSGKTSVLNLLKDHLGDKAIIVEFSTWLPGSQDTLASYLLADIASECKKRYMVPGLRRGARRIARAVAQTVPFLTGFLEFLPDSTQRDDIGNLKRSLLRVPKRVLVLLDELDRMEKEEAITLLKVLRGISILPNLTFVCALDVEELIRIVKGEANLENRNYFEKFFPVTVPLPKSDPQMMRNVGVQRCTLALERQEWFGTPNEKEKFQSDLTAIWGEVIAPFCQNLRAIGLLANDVSVAASLLRKEVDPIDLLVMEMLRRLRPRIYSLIAKNALTLTGGESWLRGGDYVSDARKEREKKEFLEELAEANQETGESEAMTSLLSYLFPKFEGSSPWRKAAAPDAEIDKRISNASMFAAYFRYELPEAVFSSSELESFLARFRRAGGEAGRRRLFQDVLHNLPKGSLKRDDFLRKLSEVVRSLDADEAIALASEAAIAANEYTYDMLPAFGESGHALRILIRTAERLSVADRIKLLSEAILNTTDDTMAVRVLLRLTGNKGDVHLDLKFADLYPAFVQRMRGRYGPGVDAANIDLSDSDPDAFNVWGARKLEGVTPDPRDAAIQRDFWLRRIGRSRSRLADVFGDFIMPVKYAYQSDPTEFIENKLPVDDLRRLFEELPDTEPLTEVETKSLRRLRNFLDGKFKNGVPLGDAADSEDGE